MPDEVFALVRTLVEAVGPVPVMIERDDDYPPLDELRAEVHRLADAAGPTRQDPGRPS